MTKGERAMVVALLLVVVGVLTATYFVWKKDDVQAAAPTAATTSTTAKAVAPVKPATTTTTSVAPSCVARTFTDLSSEAMNKPYAVQAPVVQKWISECGSVYPAKTVELKQWQADHDPNRKTGVELVRTW